MNKPSGWTSCLMVLVFVSISYDIFDMRLPAESVPGRGSTKAWILGRIAMDRCPVGETTKVYTWSQSVGAYESFQGHPNSPCHTTELPSSLMKVFKGIHAARAMPPSCRARPFVRPCRWRGPKYRWRRRLEVARGSAVCMI